MLYYLPNEVHSLHSLVMYKYTTQLRYTLAHICVTNDDNDDANLEKVSDKKYTCE